MKFIFNNRNKIFVIIAFVAVFFFSLSDRCFPATWLDPSLKFKTIETLHFNIHYQQGLRPAAEEVALIAEETYTIITQAIDHYPIIKTEVLLIDTSDFANGFTNIFPQPQVTLYLTNINSNSHSYAFKLWLKFVFLHEFAHVVHLDILGGLWNPFGRIFFPNSIQPWFMIEGTATYMETKYLQGGRGKDPLWDGIMRMEVLENNEKNAEQASQPSIVAYPGGETKYIYGVYFLNYLSEKYGEEKLRRIFHEWGEYIFTLGGIDHLFFRVYRKSLSTLWREWLLSLRVKSYKYKGIYEQSKKKIKTLTDDGYYKFNPKWSKDGNKIYFNQSNGHEPAQISRYDFSTGKREKVIEGPFNDDAFSFMGNRIFYSKAGYYNKFYIFKDLYVYDLNTRKEKRLTSGLRIQDPAISSDGKTIVFVKNEKGTRSLWIMDAEKGAAKQLLFGPKGSQYFSPSFSKDNKSILYAKWYQGGNQDIYLYNFEDKTEKKIFLSPYREGNPAFSPDEKYVLFDSDQSGVINLYAYDLSKEKLFKITNVAGAAIMPAVSPDKKKIAFINYSSAGYDLALIDYNPSEWEETSLEAYEEKPFIFDTSKANEVILDEHDYNPISQLMPKFWFPYFFYNPNGEHLMIYTGGTDILMNHLYFFQGGYDWTAKRPEYSLLYRNNQFLPQIVLQLAEFSYPYVTSNNDYYWEFQKHRRIYFTFYDYGITDIYSQGAVVFGLKNLEITNISSREIYSPQPDIGNLTGITWGLRFTRLKSYIYSISPEEGIDFTMFGNYYLKDLGSDFSITNYLCTLKAYRPSIFQHHVFLASLDLSYSLGDTLSQGICDTNLTMRIGKTLSSRKNLITSLEYRFPLSYPQSGYGFGYMFFDRLWGNLFFEAGGETNQSLENISLESTIGAEIAVDTSMMYGYIPFTFKLGYARSLKDDTERIYFTFGL